MISLFNRVRHHFLPPDTTRSDLGKVQLRESGERAIRVQTEAVQLLRTWEDERRTEEKRLFNEGTGNFVEFVLTPRRDPAHE